MSSAAISTHRLRSIAGSAWRFPDARVWRTPTGVHHVTAIDGESGDQPIALDLDSAVFAPHWNAGWKGRPDLRGPIVIGFGVPTRADVDDRYRDMTSAGVS
jgi:hypothetical protein